MSWAKIDDRLFLHPKFLGLSLSAAGLWLLGLSYAASLERDGWFPADVLARLTAAPERDTYAHELVHAGLWLRDADGYRIHDYLTYNLSRKQLTTKRNRDARRQKLSRAESKASHTVTRRGVHDSRPVPSRPVPDPTLFAIAKSARATKAHRVPDTEALTEARRADALRLGVPADQVDAHWAEFVDVEFRVARSDWSATWRNSCRRAVAHGFGAGHREAKSWQEREDDYQARKVAATIAELKAERGES